MDFVAVDLKKEIANAGIAGIQAQACYEGRYWSTTPLGRQVTVSGLLPEIKKRGIRILSHGATGRGNDQVRFQLITNMLEPSFAVYAPWRDDDFLNRFGGRLSMIAYCEQHGLPIKASREKPYSTDANLLGLTHEAGKLELLSTPAHFIEPEMGVWPEQAVDKAEEVAVRFEKGTPVCINGKSIDSFAAMQMANDIGGRHGIGIGVQLVLDRRARKLFDRLSSLAAEQIYHGYWNDVASRMLKQAIAETAELEPWPTSRALTVLRPNSAGAA